jgi:uncharacterized protein YraI
MAASLSWQHRRRGLLLTLVVMLLTGALAVSAQGLPTPVNIGDNVIGEISAANPAPTYLLNNTAPQQINVQVIAITQGFLPAFDILDPSGVVIQTSANNGTQNVVAAAPALSNVGLYTIRVSSANGLQGQFLLSLQAGVPLLPPTPITIGQIVQGTVSTEASRAAYSFTASPTDILLLTVRSTSPTSGPVVMLKDATSSETLAVASARLIGERYRIPTGTTNYLVEVTHTGAQTPEAFVVCLESENGAPVCPVSTAQVVQASATPIPAQPTATLIPLPQSGSCIVASATGGAVNVRSGPGTNYSIITQLSGNGTAAVVGRLPDNSWLQINLNGITGWIASSVTRLGGQCGLVPAITLTPTTSATIINPPTFTATAPGATATSTLTPTSTLPGATATFTLTETPTETPTLAAVPTLNFSLSPNYGSTALTSGFVPDPFTVAMTSGGNVDVSYLGGGCTGFASSAPDYRVNYTSGGFPTLRFYFIGSGDTTMIINTPGGSYVCVDDSFGTLNPTIDFNAPSSGAYDVWIGSFASGTFVSGTLNVTENTGNHP